MIWIILDFSFDQLFIWIIYQDIRHRSVITRLQRNISFYHLITESKSKFCMQIKNMSVQYLFMIIYLISFISHIFLESFQVTCRSKSECMYIYVQIYYSIAYKNKTRSHLTLNSFLTCKICLRIRQHDGVTLFIH